MRFRNYRNRYNMTNRIFSDEDLLNMKLAEIFNNENDILAQNHEIGVPTVSELQNSKNTRWIEPFVGAKGFAEGGCWQSIPEAENAEEEDEEDDDEEGYTPQDEQEPTIEDDNLQNVLQGKVEYNDTKPISHIEELASIYEGLTPKAVLQEVFANNPVQKITQKVNNTLEKYEGLSPMAAAQKAAAKNMPYWKSSEKEYYQHALKLADGEEPTEFMKQNNDFYKIHEISDPELKRIYIEKAAKMYGLDINDPATYDAVKNTDVVMPKIDSQLYSQIKNSEDFQRWVAENYENIKNQTNKNECMKFSPEWGQYNLFATINNTDLKNSKINEDGSFSTILSDAYDFDNWKKQDWIHSDKDAKEKVKMFLSNRIVPTNNRAKEQQDAEQLQRYLLSTQINLSKKEIDEILRKYGHIK